MWTFRLVYGRDYAGNVCGTDNFTTFKFTTYPRLDDDLLAGMAEGLNAADIQFFGVCAESCPTAGASVCTYDNSSCWTTAQDTTAVLFRCLPLESTNETVVGEECVDPYGADANCTAQAYANGECDQVCHTKRVEKKVWEIEATTTNPLIEQLQGYAQVLGRFVSDMAAAKWLVLAVGGGGAMVFGLLWLLALQYVAGCVVWLTCLLVLVLLVLLSLFCSIRSGLIDSTQIAGLAFLNATDIETDSLTVSADSTTRLQFKAASYVMWALTIVVVLLIIAMHKRIHIAVAVIRESSRAVRKMPLLLLWPAVPAVGFVALVVYCIAIAACLLSADDLGAAVQSTASAFNATTVEVQALPAKTTQQALLAFHVFGFLWTNQLLQAVSICAVAGAVAQFYWTQPDAHGRRRLDSRFPIARAVGTTLRFHLGSLCFGAFVIALVQFLRLVLEYVDRNTKELQSRNGVVKVVFLAVKCCLWCFEKCLKFLSKNAYIMIAMRGSSFCSASATAFRLLLANLARVAVVNTISFFLLLLVKLTVALTAGIVVFAALSNSTKLSASAASALAILGNDPVTSPMAPVLAATILAWLVASAFVNVYDTAIDTILLCFCEDTRLHNGGVSPYMSDELRRLMGDSAAPRTVIHVAPAGAKEGGTGPGSDARVHADS